MVLKTKQYAYVVNARERWILANDSKRKTLTFERKGILMKDRPNANRMVLDERIE